MRQRRRAGVVALALLLGAGCSPSEAPERDAAPTQRDEWAVAADEDATTAEMVAVGAPSDVAVSADGERRLVTWYVEAGDDEVPGWAAWRLYDADGGTVTDGHYPQVGDLTTQLEVEAVTDGFVLFTTAYGIPRVVHVAPDGATETARRTGPAPVRAGDVLLDYSAGYPARVWSPTDRTVHRLPRFPRRDVQDVAVDASGTVHLRLPPPLRPQGQGRGGIVLSSAGGTGPWSRSTVPLPRARGEASDLVATPDGLLLLTLQRLRADAVWRHPDGPDGRWTRVARTPRGVDVDPGDGALTEVVADDGPHLVLVGSRASWVSDGDGWQRIEPPVPDGAVQPAGGRLWFRGYVEGDLWVSEDLGATWDEVPR